MKIKPYLKQIDVVNLALEEKVIDGLQLSSYRRTNGAMSCWLKGHSSGMIFHSEVSPYLTV